MLRRKFYAIIGIGALMTIITTCLSIASLTSNATVEIIIVLAINLGVFAALLIGLLEYLVFHRIRTLADGLKKAEKDKSNRYKLIDLGADDEISFITEKFNQSIDRLEYSKHERTDIVIQYKPVETPETKAI